MIKWLKEKFDDIRFKLIDYGDDVVTTYDEPDIEDEWYTQPPQERMKRIAQEKQSNTPFYKQDSKPWE